MRKTLMLMVTLSLLLAGTALSGDRVVQRVENLPFILGNEPFPDVSYHPSPPGLITDSPGEVVGGTQYDYQSNGSSGRRIAFDSDGGVHVVWMNGTSYPSAREVDYNYRDVQGTWLVPELGVTVSELNGAGYVQVDITTDNRSAVAYHQWQLADYSVLAVDNFSGMGIFSYFDVPDMLELRCYWPYIAVDRNDNIQIIVNEQAPNAGDPHTMGYTRSSDGGETWSGLVEVDTLMTLSGVVVSSPVSDKVAIAYTHPRDHNSQWYNDIYYIESEDGITWPWRTGKVNVTEYGSGEETFWAYIDMAAVYDYNDNLNLLWNVLEVSGDTLYYPVHLLHYSTGSGMMTDVAQSAPEWPDGGCGTGAWNLQIAKMSLGVNEATNAIYALYTGFDAEDCSANGYANGDLYMTYSVDGGASWVDSVNVTDSQTPGCITGECDSDHWSSLAARVGENLHIAYINDKDAGGIAQTEGSVTDNPVLYLAYPNPVTGIEDDPEVPAVFSLFQNYPNPFNARTTIEFDLEDESDVKLSIYDITGAEVAILHDGNLKAGKHSIGWDATEAASGVYYYSLSAKSGSLTRKMTLLK